jgi:hypothetical protein
VVYKYPDKFRRELAPRMAATNAGNDTARLKASPSGLSSYQDQTGLATLARTINLSWRSPVLAKAVCRKHSPFVYHFVR